MNSPTLAYLEDAQRRGAVGTAGIQSLRPDGSTPPGHSCEVCRYHAGSHHLDDRRLP